MGWPDLSFPARLEPSLRSELTQLTTLLQGYLSAEHDGDGRHTAITVESIAFRDANGDVLATIAILDGELVFTVPPRAPLVPGDPSGVTFPQPVQITNILIGARGLSTTGGSDTAFAVIELNTRGGPGGPDAAFADRWAVASGRDTLGQYVAIGDHQGQDYGAKLYYRPGEGYLFAPPINANPNSYRLGDRLAPPLLWHEVNARQVYARDGYLERTRTVPMGEWIDVPFNATNFAGAGAEWIVTPAQVLSNQYTLLGKTMIWTLSVSNSTIAAPGAVVLVLYLPIPTAGAATSFALKPGLVYDVTGPQQDYTLQVTDAFSLVLTRNGPAIPAGGFYLYFTITLEVN